MWAFAHRHLVIVLFAMMIVLSPLAAQEKQEPAGEAKFWTTTAGLEVEAAGHVIGASTSFGHGNFFGAWGARVLAGEYTPLEKNWKIEFEEPLPIYHRYLSAIEDGHPLPVIDIVKGKPVPPFWGQKPNPDWGWYLAYNDALHRSEQATLDLFKKGAEEFKHVSYANLKDTPRKLRGKIITVTGKLIVIRKVDPPRYVGAEIPEVYTGYILGPTRGAPPFAVAFLELPEGFEPSEKLDLHVTFHGYFLSLVLFPPDKADKTHKGVVSPYLVGRTMIINPPDKTPPVEPDDKTAYSYYIIVWTVGAILGIAVLVALLNLWFRRGDRRIHSQLAALRQKQQPFDLEPNGAEPAPENPADAPHDPNPPAPPV
jgi:hypothetical protein